MAAAADETCSALDEVRQDVFEGHRGDYWLKAIRFSVIQRDRFMVSALIRGAHMLWALAYLDSEEGRRQKEMLNSGRGRAPRRAFALHAACAQGLIDEVRGILENTNADVDMADEQGATALHIACAVGALSCVQLLLEYAASAVKVDSLGRIPLHAASDHGHAACVRLLLECRDGEALVLATDGRLRTPLHLACAAADGDGLGCAELLVRFGAPVNARAQGERTPLLAACAAHRLSCAALLVRSNAYESDAQKAAAVMRALQPATRSNEVEPGLSADDIAAVRLRFEQNCARAAAFASAALTGGAQQPPVRPPVGLPTTPAEAACPVAAGEAAPSADREAPERSEPTEGGSAVADAELLALVADPLRCTLDALRQAVSRLETTATPEALGVARARRDALKKAARRAQAKAQQKEKKKTAPGTDSAAPAERDVRGDEDDHGAVAVDCTVCLDKPPTHAFIPCGHRCVCEDCADLVCTNGRAGVCPICRAASVAIVQIWV